MKLKFKARQRLHELLKMGCVISESALIADIERYTDPVSEEYQGDYISLVAKTNNVSITHNFYTSDLERV